MAFRALIEKLKAKQELTDDELRELEAFNPDENRIPKSRLDEEIGKRNKAETSLEELKAKFAEASARLEEMENNGLSAQEKAKKEFDKQLSKMQSQIDGLTQERDKANAELAGTRRTAAISAIAGKYKFSDSAYLDFLASQKGVDIGDDNAVDEFVRELSASCPQLFQSDAKSGSGMNGGGVSEADALKAQIQAIMHKEQLTMRDAGEVQELQAKLDALATK